jgi:hypothetical protein
MLALKYHLEIIERDNPNNDCYVGISTVGKSERWIIFLDGPTYLGKIPVGSKKKER